MTSKKYILLILGSILLSVGTVQAATHYIPEDLQKEQKQLEQKLIATQNAETYFELAMSYAYTGWVEVAWDQLKKVPEYDENYADIVIAKYSKKIKEEPENWKHYFKMAFGYYFKGNKDMTLLLFIKAHAAEPKQPWIIGFMSLLEGENKNYDKAIELAKKAIAIEPNGTALHFLLAQAYSETGNFFGALGEGAHVIRLKSSEAKYRPVPPSFDEKK